MKNIFFAGCSGKHCDANEIKKWKQRASFSEIILRGTAEEFPVPLVPRGHDPKSFFFLD